MKKHTRFGAAVLLLTAVTLIFMFGWWFCNRPQEDGTWYVEVQRNDAPEAGKATEEDTWPESLLEGEVINLNRASAAELQRLPGIGPGRAQAIIEYRTQKGAFTKADDLLQVEGIGPVLLERLCPYVSTEEN